MKRKRVLESTVEGAVLKFAKKNGCLIRKMNGLGFNSWPDRLFIHRDSGRSAWIEFKRPDEEPTGAQFEMLLDLAAAGQNVAWFDDALEAIEWLQRVWMDEGTEFGKMRNFGPQQIHLPPPKNVDKLAPTQISAPRSKVPSRARRGRTVPRSRSRKN